MISATAALRQEHTAILRMLDATEEVAARLERGDRVTSDTLEGLLEFFRIFADRCHHTKEEDLLFPRLEQKGMPHQGGPIGVMLREHTMGRSLIRQMAEASEDYRKDAAGAGSRWANAAAEYAALLRSHIEKENNILFVIAERLLSDADQQELSEQFERIEMEKIGAGTHQRLHGLMERIVKEVFAEARPTPMQL